LLWVFPHERPKDRDQTTDEVREDFADAIADRVRAAGLYDAPGGDEGIFVATVRAIVHMAMMSPAMSKRKVIIVGDAERMVPQEGSEMAANAFLKVLEEPPANTTVILTSSEPAGLLPTIRSRVVALRVSPLGDAEMREFLENPVVKKRLDVTAARMTEFLGAAGGSPGQLLSRGELAAATSRAERILTAATGGAGARHQTALAQGVSGARAGFSDTLDALTALLHERVRTAAVNGEDGRALNATRAIEVVEEAKLRTAQNVNPQLLTSFILQRLAPLLK
jgi:DNA polymerase-3 subunit delta'